MKPIIFKFLAFWVAIFFTSANIVFASDHYVYSYIMGDAPSPVDVYVDDTGFSNVSSDHLTFDVTCKRVYRGKLMNKYTWHCKDGQYDWAGSVYTGWYKFDSDSRAMFNICKKILDEKGSQVNNNLTQFVSYGDFTTIKQDSKPKKFNYDADGEDVKFATDSMGNLRLYNKKGDVDYLSFIPKSNTDNVYYEIREVHTESPEMTFYEIVASREGTLNDGTKNENTGYWMIGKNKGNWVTYISTASLATMGYKENEPHHISSKIGEDGCLYIYSVKKHGYYDFTVSAFWDKKANWFGLKRIG